MASRSERALGSTSSGSRGREVLGIVLLGLAIFVGLSVASLQLGNGRSMGPCGATVGLGVYALVGVGAYLAALGLGFAALRCLQGEPVRVRSVAFWAALGVGVSIGDACCISRSARTGCAATRPAARSASTAPSCSIAFVGRVGAFCSRAWCSWRCRWCCRRRCRSAPFPSLLARAATGRRRLAGSDS